MSRPHVGDNVWVFGPGVSSEDRGKKENGEHGVIVLVKTASDLSSKEVAMVEPQLRPRYGHDWRKMWWQILVSFDFGIKKQFETQDERSGQIKIEPYF